MNGVDSLLLWVTKLEMESEAQADNLKVRVLGLIAFSIGMIIS